jgi:hypothetical protein
MESRSHTHALPLTCCGSEAGSYSLTQSETTVNESVFTGELKTLMSLLGNISTRLADKKRYDSRRKAMAELQPSALAFIAVLSAVLENNSNGTLLSSISVVPGFRRPKDLLKQIDDVLCEQFKFLLPTLEEAVETGRPIDVPVLPLLNCMLRVKSALELAESKHQRPILKRKKKP